MICGRYTVSSENLEEGLYRNTEKQNIDEPETQGWKGTQTSFNLPGTATEAQKEDKARDDGQLLETQEYTMCQLLSGSIEMEV